MTDEMILYIHDDLMLWLVWLLIAGYFRMVSLPCPGTLFRK